MKNTHYHQMKTLTVLPLLIFISLFLIGCSPQKDDNQSAYISINLPSSYSKTGGISSRAFDNTELNLDSIVISISNTSTKEVLASVDILNLEGKSSSIKVPAKTDLTVVGTAFQNEVLKFRGELNAIKLQPGERKNLQLPLTSSLLIDISIDNKPANGDLNNGISFSGNNRYILFSSNSDNLVDGDDNAVNDLFLRDIINDTTSTINSDETGALTTSSAISEADVSADGFYVVFASDSNEFVQDDVNAVQDIFLKNMLTNELLLISVGSEGEPLSQPSSNPQISDDGSVITYYYPGDANRGEGVYLYNRLTQSPPSRVKRAKNNYSLSGDGKSIVYIDRDGYFSHYNIGTTESPTVIDDDPGQLSFNVSQNGLYIIFSKAAPLTNESVGKPLTNARAIDQNSLEDGQIYLYSLADGTFEHVSSDVDGNKITGALDNFPPNISNDGKYAVFTYDNRVYVKDIPTKKLENLTEGNSAFISAAGDQIGYNFDAHIYIIDNPLYTEPTTPITKPLSPDSVDIRNNGPIILTWTKSDDANYYRIYQSHEETNEDGDSVIVIEIYETTDLKLYAIKNVTPGEIYKFIVISVNDDGESLESEEVEILSVLDETQPRVTGISPADNATNVSINSNIIISFSEPIDPNSINQNSIILRENNELIVTGSLNFINNQIIFNPTDPLLNTMDYTISVDSGIKDLAGNLITTTNQTSFTTVIVDIIKPRVTTTYPADSATDFAVDIDIQVTFSEEINPDTATETSITLYDDSGNPLPGSIFTSVTRKISTIFLESPLLYNKTYTLKVTKGIKDLAGNELETESITTFTTIALPDEGTINTPIGIIFYDTHNGFVGNGKSYYKVINISEDTSDIPFIWLENTTDIVEVISSATPFDTDYAPLPCDNSVCILTGYEDPLYMRVNGVDTIAGSQYDILSNRAQTNFADGSRIYVNFSSPIQTKFIIFEGLIPGDNYYISLPTLADEKFNLRFMTDNFKTCQINKLTEPKMLGCETIANADGNILVELSGENLTLPFNKYIEANLIIKDQFTHDLTIGDTYSFLGSYQDLYFELGNLEPEVNYSIKVNAAPYGGTDETITFYTNNWNLTNCEVLYIYNADFTFCETKSDVNGKIYVSVSSESYGESDPTTFTFTFTASEIISKELIQESAFGFTLPTPELAIELDPVKYFNMQNLEPSIYAVSMNVNTYTNNDNNSQPMLNVYHDEWYTPACNSINFPSLGFLCLTDLTTRINKDLYFNTYDIYNNINSPTTVDLNITPINVTDITNNIPYIDTTTGLLADSLKVYKVSNLTPFTEYEIYVSLNNSFPIDNTFYVVSGELDELLCTGYRSSPTDTYSYCSTYGLTQSTEIYIIMDLQGVPSGSTYSIDYVVPCPAPATFCGITEN